MIETYGFDSRKKQDPMCQCTGFDEYAAQVSQSELIASQLIVTPCMTVVCDGKLRSLVANDIGCS